MSIVIVNVYHLFYNYLNRSFLFQITVSLLYLGLSFELFCLNLTIIAFFSIVHNDINWYLWGIDYEFFHCFVRIFKVDDLLEDFLLHFWFFFDSQIFLYFFLFLNYSFFLDNYWLLYYNFFFHYHFLLDYLLDIYWFLHKYFLLDDSWCFHFSNHQEGHINVDYLFFNNFHDLFYLYWHLNNNFFMCCIFLLALVGFLIDELVMRIKKNWANFIHHKTLLILWDIAIRYQTSFIIKFQSNFLFVVLFSYISFEL
jgi:hypothetical protein